MTFSDHRIARDVSESYVAVCESVAPVEVAAFELGDGRVLSGIAGGEIALYFCRPDGIVFDILPGLQTPVLTWNRIVEAAKFYAATGATEEAIGVYHQGALESGPPGDELAAKPIPREELVAEEEATRAMGTLAWSKSAAVTKSGELVFYTDFYRKNLDASYDRQVYDPQSSLTVVEPGGLARNMRRIHEAFLTRIPGTPAEWKQHVFVDILGHELRGGVYLYDIDTARPLPDLAEEERP